MPQITTLQIGMFQTLALAVLSIYFGGWVRDRLPVLKKYCIPSPVVGGTIFAILTTILFVTNIITFEFDYTTINTFFYNVFFAASGMAASLSLLKKGGKLVIIFAILAAVLSILQNAIALGIGVPMGMNPLTALMAGSTPLTGGHGNAASFAPIAGEAGGINTLEVAVAAATYGLIAGCIIGGPIGRSIIRKKKLDEGYTPEEAEKEAEFDINLDATKILATQAARAMRAAFLLLLACGIGQTLFTLAKVALPGVNLPIHVMCMLGGIVLRLVLDATKKGNEPLYNTIGIISEISLALFVSMSIITMQLWTLAKLALPLITILIVQTIFIWIFVRWVTFNACGRDYDAAIIAVGHSGFGMGAVPVSMATMTEVCNQYHYSKVAFFVVPVIGGFISNLTNAVIITTFINFAAGLL